MKCKYFVLRGECRHCANITDKKGEEKECPKPLRKYFKATEWWKDNRSGDMIEFFDKLEAHE